MRRSSIAMLTLALLAFACGDASTSVDLDSYVTELTTMAEELEDEFAVAGDLIDFPIDGELATAAAGYMAYDDALDRMRSLDVPGEIADEHAIVVARLAELQEVVGDYLDKASKHGDFSFDELNADRLIGERLDALESACDDLDETLVRAGAGSIPSACGLVSP